MSKWHILGRHILPLFTSHWNIALSCKYISCKRLSFLLQGLPHQPGIGFYPLHGWTPHLSDGLLSCHLLWEASSDLPDYQIPLLEVVDSLAAFPSKHLSWTQLDIYLWLKRSCFPLTIIFQRAASCLVLPTVPSTVPETQQVSTCKGEWINELKPSTVFRCPVHSDCIVCAEVAARETPSSDVKLKKKACHLSSQVSRLLGHS